MDESLSASHLLTQALEHCLRLDSIATMKSSVILAAALIAPAAAFVSKSNAKVSSRVGRRPPGAFLYRFPSCILMYGGTRAAFDDIASWISTIHRCVCVQYMYLIRVSIIL
jgi:hypothetical protein